MGISKKKSFKREGKDMKEMHKIISPRQLDKAIAKNKTNMTNSTLNTSRNTKDEQHEPHQKLFE